MMRKRFLTLLPISAMGIFCAEAREFHNVDKTQSFTAEVTEFDKQSELVTVQRDDGEVLTFELSVLWEDDRTYVRENFSGEQESEDESDEGQLYDPNASYGERQKALQKAFEDIPANFDDEWPTLVEFEDAITVTLVSENEEAKEYIYHSDHYEFVCDVALKPHLVERFADLFEGTREMCRQLPIATKKAHIAGQTHRNRILLFESKETYVKNGGPSSSAGVYMGSKDVVMVPLTSIGVKKVGSSYSVDYDGSNKVLPHELTHQLTDACYYVPGSRGWFSEGLADYVAVTPYRSGKFMLTKTENAARDYATEYGRKGNGGRALGDEIRAPALKDYMLQSYSSFTANANFNYGLALMVTTYFFEMENNGDRVAITAFLKALREGKEGEDALAELRQGRSFDELAEDISRGWRSKGIDIEFAKSEE
jgi:hypothetical protein